MLPNSDLSEATENASTEYASTNMQGWKMQVRKTPVRVSRGGKRKYESATVENVSRPTTT